MLGASFLFASMGVCVKLASSRYGTGEIVMYRGLIGMVFILTLVRLRGGSLRTAVPAMHFWRSLVGVASLLLWFYSIGGLPLATAMTLNYMSSVWMALFIIGGAVVVGGARVDTRLVFTVLAGFAGVALVLRPTIERQQLWHGLMGLMSGVLAALAYLQVTALARAGEPDHRIVFYFSIGAMLAGGLLTLGDGPHAHTLGGLALLLAVGILAVCAQLMLTRAYAIGNPLSNATLQYTGIVYAIGYGVLIFGDRLSAMALAGIALIAGAGIGATVLRRGSVVAK